MNGKPRLLDQMHKQIRLKRYSIRTERASIASGSGVLFDFITTATCWKWNK